MAVPGELGVEERTTFAFEIARADANGAVDGRRGEATGSVEDLGGGVRIDMIDLPGGSFVMGSSDAEQSRAIAEFTQSLENETRRSIERWVRAEGPQHQVTVS